MLRILFSSILFVFSVSAAMTETRAGTNAETKAETKTAVLTETGTEAELVGGTQSLRPDVPFRVALRLKPKKGWHTYWRHAGDSGLPTKIKWRLPVAPEQ